MPAPQNSRPSSPIHFQCSKCPFKTVHKNSLQIHQRRHTGEKPFKCPHPDCPALFSSSSALYRHNSVHAIGKNFECPSCPLKYKSTGTLKRHQKWAHETDTPLQCPHCQYRTKHAGYLKVHVKTVHLKVLHHKCPHCDYIASSSGNLTRHTKYIHPEILADPEVKKYVCAVCPLKFMTAGDLRSHATVHTSLRPFTCPSCPFRTRTACHLKRHVSWRHSLEKPMKCGMCNYATVCRTVLNDHIRSHTGERPFKCPFEGCQYTAAGIGSIRTHQTVHSNNKPFTCKVSWCGFKASRRAYLTGHMKLMHSKGRAMIPEFFQGYRCTAGDCEYSTNHGGRLALHLNFKHGLPTVSLENFDRTESDFRRP